MEVDFQTVSTAIGSLIALGTCFTIYQKIIRGFRRGKERREAKLLQDAKEAASVVKLELKKEIDDTNEALENYKVSMEKELAHIKETSNSEIKNLAQNIENLRDELRQQYQQMVQLLAKMIDKE